MSRTGFRTLAALAVLAALPAGVARAQDAAAPPDPGSGTAGTADAADALGEVDVVDRVVAVVGDEIVLLSEVEEEVYLAGLRGEFSLTDPAAVDERRRQVLDQLVESKILLAEARRRGIQVEREEIDRALEDTIADVRRRFPDEEAFLEQLRKEGVTLDQLRSSQRGKLEEQLTVRQLVDREVRSRVDVDEREIRAAWDERRERIPNMPARLDLSRILVAVRTPGDVDSAAVRRADIVKARLDAGESFATLARAFSEGPNAAEGGALGWFLPEDLDPAVTEALRGVQPGGTTGVVVSPRGALILRVDEADPRKGVRLSQIVFLRDEKAARAAARARAEEIRARLAAGEDFEALAKAESDDTTTAPQGGHVGIVPLESLDDVYRNALDRVEPGTLADLIEDAEGFSIVRVNAREGEREATYDDVHDRLAEVVRASKGRDLYEELLTSARERTYVETRLEDDAG